MKKYNVGFPDEYAHPNIKAGDDWGIQAAKAIWDYGVHHCGWGLESRRDQFHQNELYARGDQNPNIYKPAFGDKEGTVKYMHMMWQVTSPFPPYVRSVIQSLIEQRHEPKVTSYDPTSTSEKDKVYKKQLSNVLLKKLEQNELAGTGISLTSKHEQIEENVEAVELRKDQGFKNNLEIAIQIGLKAVLENNHIDQKKRETASSLTINSWAAVMIYYDQFNDIKFDSMNVRDLIIPYSEDPYFKSRKFTGYIKNFTISEIRSYNVKNGKPVYSDEELYKLAEENSAQHGNGSWSRDWGMYSRSEPWNSFLVPVLMYEILTLNRSSWLQREKPDGTKTFNLTKAHAQEKKSDKKQVVSKERLVWYDGMWILNSNKILQHELRDNMVYDSGINGFYEGEPKSRFIVCAPDIYQMRNKALPESAKPYLDNMQKAMLKVQQLTNEIAPPMMKVDIDSIEGVMDGLGITNGKPMDIALIAKQTRIWYYSSKSDQLGQNNQNPVAELPSYIRNEITAAAESYNINLAALERETGVNDQMIGQNRNRYEGLGAREMKESAGLKAISHLQHFQDYLWEEVIDRATIMVQDTIARGDKIKGFENALGRENVRVINLQHRATIAELGMKLEMLPTQEDLINLQRKVDLALQARTIDIQDAIQVEEIGKTDVKLAYRYMAMKQVEYEKREARKIMEASKANGEQQQQSVQMKAEMDMKLKEMESRMKAREMELEAMLKEQLQQAEHLDNVEREVEVERVKGEEKIRQIREANRNLLDKTESNSTEIRQPQVYTGKSA